MIRGPPFYILTEQIKMQSFFWRIFATFWLATAAVAGLSLLLGHMFKQDEWILANYPNIQNLAADWTRLYEQRGPLAAQLLLERRNQKAHVQTQVFDDAGERLIPGTTPPRAENREAHARYLPWRRISEEYQSPRSGKTYLFIYRIPHNELSEWQRQSLFWPVSALIIALVVLTLFSALLTLSITRPLNRLRSAVHDLGQTSYHQHSLAKLATRRDEFGTLAHDFNRMGARLQDLICSQRQLLRDVSHELRSPLARLRIALALAERATPEARTQLWPRLTRECDRLESLISEILTLARMDSESSQPHIIDLNLLLPALEEDARLLVDNVQLNCTDTLPTFQGWPDLIERALDNLIRNAARFNPAEQPLEISASVTEHGVRVNIRDHGPGVAEEHLARLGEPFFRAPGQESNDGYGLGLAIARRAAQRHGGQLQLSNHPEGGLLACLELPLNP